jgi:deoxycytidine triphosphate deaminase
MEPWAKALIELFWEHRDALLEVCARWPTLRYEHHQREGVVTDLADLMLAGVPGHPTVGATEGAPVNVLDSDVVNAAWVARSEAAEAPIGKLGVKAIETLEFTRRWVANGGNVPFPEAPESIDEHASVLAEAELSARLVARENRLVVTPLLQLPKGSALDLRLGNRFIVFRRTIVEAFDPLASTSDPRAIQMDIELAWTERFVLHPNEMVLGATLEYLVLPEDLSAQVVTRSSYGRLGLLSATAVQVHPHFHGCLTLELVNLGTIPISLTPGERIAQLVVSKTGKVPDPGRDKYFCATGPEFSKVRDDPESEVLRSLRDGRD